MGYERASILTLNPTARISVIPVILPQFFFLLSTGTWTFMVCLGGPLRSTQGLVGNLGYSILLLGSAYAYGLKIAWLRCRIYDTIKTFDIRTAVCHVESDRVLVHKNVAS